MSCNCLGQMRIGQTVIAMHIRRIAGNYEKEALPKMAVLLIISCSDGNRILQMIIHHTAPCHLGTLFLNLRPVKCSPCVFAFNRIGIIPVPVPRSNACFPFLHPGKVRQQHRIDTITKIPGILDNMIAILQIMSNAHFPSMGIFIFFLLSLFQFLHHLSALLWKASSSLSGSILWNGILTLLLYTHGSLSSLTSMITLPADEVH